MALRIRASVVVAMLIGALLVLPVAISSHLSDLGDDPITVSFQVVDSLGDPNHTMPYILGASVDWPDGANGLYNTLSGLLNPAPVGELIGLEPSYLRFPAGKLSQNYNWSRGVGKVGERGLNPVHSGLSDVSDFGTDEFMKLVTHTLSRPVMVMDCIHGTPEMAAGWVSYCNDPSTRGLGKDRSDNGYFTPYGVRHWEVGYEAYDPNYWEDLGGGVPAGVAYAERLKEFSKAMKAVDPDIKIGACMVLDPDLEFTSADQSWNLNFLTEARGNFTFKNPNKVPEQVTRNYFDYVVVRIDLPGIDVLLTYDDLYSYSYAVTFDSLMSNFEQLRALINTQPGLRGRDIPMAIASFEPDFGDETWNGMAPAFEGSAVLTAEMAMRAMALAQDPELPGLLYACYGELNTPTFSSLMINPDFEAARVRTWQRSPNFHAMRLCTQLQGGTPLDVSALTGGVPTYSVGGERELPSVKGVPIVSALVTGYPEEGVFKVLLLNRGLERPVDCRITLATEGLSGRMNWTALTVEGESLVTNNLARDMVELETRSGSKFGERLTITIPPASVMLVSIIHPGMEVT